VTDILHRPSMLRGGDEANTTSNKWLTLEAWKTIMYHYYDLDDTEADIHRPSMLGGGKK
jgi:hypothetical protein